MQAFTQERQHTQPPLTIVLARVLYRHRRFPIELRHQFERQVALVNVAGVLGRIERDTRTIYRYSKK